MTHNTTRTQPEIRISKHIQTKDVYIRQDGDVIVITSDKLDSVIKELCMIQNR